MKEQQKKAEMLSLTVKDMPSPGLSLFPGFVICQPDHSTQLHHILRYARYIWKTIDQKERTGMEKERHKEL